jgi:uncharacterized damage-inducible protein DinB
MKKISLAITLAVLMLGLALQPAAAEDVNTMLLNNLKDAQDKTLQLVEAMPADKFGWRPSEGVRSVSETCMHVAGANYFFGSRMTGTKPPAATRTLEKDVTAKADVLAKLKESYDAVNAGVAKADMSAATKLFGGKEGTMGDLALIAVSHAHEHLGQLIAYARSNSVTPPWSK